MSRSGMPSSGRARAAAVQVDPILEDDLEEVGRFLGSHFPPDTAADDWAEAWRQTVNLPGSEAPNHGFLLRADGEVVGAYPAIYSTRLIDGRREHFCNLAVWYTSPEYRLHSVRMLKALLAQEGWHFTDLTPIEVVQKLNLRLGFEYLDTTTHLVPSLPWPSLPGRVQVSADPQVIRSTLTGEVKVFFEDHSACRWAKHVVVVWKGVPCYVQWRIERHKGLPFASIRYLSDPAVFRQGLRHLGRHLLVRHGALGVLVELRLAGPVGRSLRMPTPKPRMFKSASLRPDQIDYLYSEITSAP